MKNENPEGVVYNIVRYSPEHVAAVHEIETQSFSVPWSYEALDYETTNPNALYFVALCGLRVVGYVGMHRVYELGSITNIAVAPEMRRLGVADLLMSELIAQGEASGVLTFTLEVRSSNTAAQMLYKKHGFEQVGIRRGYYVHPDEDALIMNRVKTM